MIIPTYRQADATGSGLAAVAGGSASTVSASALSASGASSSRGRRGSAQASPKSTAAIPSWISRLWLMAAVKPCRLSVLKKMVPIAATPIAPASCWTAFSTPEAEPTSQSVRAGVGRALTTLGGIDVLVNNAGIGMRTVNPHFMTEPIGFWQVSPDGFRDLLVTNVVGYFLVARAVVPHMLQAGHGKIVNISVNETTTRRRGFTPYGPSRAATDSLSRIMAADLAGTGIDVNLLLPGGATRTGMVPDSMPPDTQVTWLDPAIMGPPIVWLASPASDGLTDQRIVAAGFAAR